VLERHVADWFRARWPKFFAPPDNEGEWARPCFHDFKLRLPDRVWLLDVTGRKLDGSWRNPGGGKQPVDLHLMCDVAPGDQAVTWHGVLTGDAYRGVVSPLHARSPVRMCVWLNCLVRGLSYERLGARLLQEAA
jgi:hypothetical protein